MIGQISRFLRTALLDQEYSEGYAESFLNAFVATQIKVIREQRGMTQEMLGESIGTTQAGISRYENVNYSAWSVRTLVKLARAFELRLRISFEPFGTLPDEVVRFNRQSLQRVPRHEDPELGEASLARESHVTDMAAWKALNNSSAQKAALETPIDPRQGQKKRVDGEQPQVIQPEGSIWNSKQ